MINLYNLSKNNQGQTVVLVLLYIMIVSILISGLIIISINTSTTQTSDSKFLSAKLLAKSKLDQILGAEDDLFTQSEVDANSYFAKIKPSTSNETIITNSNLDKSTDQIESLGQIIFQNSGENGNSKVTCDKTSNSQIERFYLPAYKSLQIDVNNSSYINVAYAKTDILLFTVYLQISSNPQRYTSVEFGVDTNSSSPSNGNVSSKNGEFTYPAVKNDGINPQNFLYRGVQNPSLSSPDQEVVSLDIQGLISNINLSSILKPGEAVSNVTSLEVTNISDRTEDAEMSLWGSSIPNNIIKLSCNSEIGFYDSAGTQATYSVSVYYTSGLIMPNFFNYALAIGKFIDKDGNENYVLTK